MPFQCLPMCVQCLPMCAFDRSIDRGLPLCFNNSWRFVNDGHCFLHSTVVLVLARNGCSIFKYSNIVASRVQRPRPPTV